MSQSKPNSDYNLVEDTNQGPHGARSGRVAPANMQDGGNKSSGQSAKDNLVPQSGMQVDPYRARAGDFPDGHKVSAGHGQSTGAEKLNSNTAEKDTLVPQADHQCGPRYLEDDGPGSSGAGTPSGWVNGARAARVAAAFPVVTSKGESTSAGGEVGVAESVNLQTGLIESKGYRQTKQKEIGEDKVTIS